LTALRKVEPGTAASLTAVEHIHGQRKLYRVGRRNCDDQGLWYDSDGNYTGLIHTVPGSAAAMLPMGLHPVFRSGGFEWISVTDTKEMLPLWFTVRDMHILHPRGYDVLEIDVDYYRRLHFDSYSHEVYARGAERYIKVLSPGEIWKDW
jgi:hypothetical protein